MFNVSENIEIDGKSSHKRIVVHRDIVLKFGEGTLNRFDDKIIVSVKRGIII
jgi:hypothetical protein